MDGKNIKIVSVIIAAITAIIAFLALMFGEGVIWRIFPKDEGQVTLSSTPYNTPTTTEVVNDSALDDSSEEAVPTVVQPAITDTVATPKAVSADSQVISLASIQTNTTSSGLSLVISDCQYFYDGFYHQMPESDSAYSFVEYDQGISGHFSYSRELTDIEYEDWGHGGKILDANGNELDINASFYATTDGVFAVELPEDMPSGTYTYLLYLFVHDEYCEARIPFTW